LAVETKSPSFLAFGEGHLYAANETQEGAVTGFSIDHGSGKLTQINSASVKSAGPCHLMISGRWVLVANYSGGSVTVLPIESGGKLGEATDVVQHRGSGPNRDHQDTPHAHWVGMAPGHLAMVADLGLDQILLYNFDSRHGKLTPGNPAFANVAAGAGARHAAMHPSGKFLYVVNELNSTLSEFYFESEFRRLSPIQTLSTLPDGFKGANSGAEIAVHPSGKFVYTSNRGHDSIAVFSVNDPKKGTLTSVEFVPTRGKTPRQFEIDPSGKWLLVANQNSNSISIYSIDTATGKLTPGGLVEGVVKPTCIKFR
jgi:6-phosphogluconolactonase